MTEYFDREGEKVKRGDIIDLHQTVNGCSKFLIQSLDPLEVEYFEDWCKGRKYEYDKESLLTENGWHETEYEIIDNVLPF